MCIELGSVKDAEATYFKYAVKTLMWYNAENAGFLVAQMVKNLPARQRLEFDPWVRKIPWRR